MSTPVVIQGTPVVQHPPQSQPSAFTGLSAPNNNNNNNHNGARDDKVESSCNDPLFAILFYIALIAIIIVAATYGADALENGTIDDGTDNGGSSSSSGSSVDYSGYITITVIVTFLSFIGAGLGMSLLFCIPQFLIKAALIFTVVMAGVWCGIAFATGNLFGGILGAIFFAISICYAYAVWSRIPFATANLVTACTAIKANLGVALYAYVFALLAGLWAIGWAVAVIGVFDQTYNCTQVNGKDVCDASGSSYGILFLLFLAFFFVQQVLQVTLHAMMMRTFKFGDVFSSHEYRLGTKPHIQKFLLCFECYRTPFMLQ